MLELLTKIQDILGAILPILITIGVLFFVWGVIKYFIADSEEAKTKGKDTIVYGIIGFAIILSMWAIVDLGVKAIGGNQNAPAFNNLSVQQQNQNTGSGCKDLPLNPKLQDVLGYFVCLVNNSVIPFIFALATVMFIWGAVKFFIINSEEEAKRDQGKQFMLWGIIALAVMLSVWGIVGILRATIFGENTPSVLPQVCPPGGCRR